MPSNAEQIREYYNDFLLKRMVSYRLYGNLRIEVACKFFCDYAEVNSTIVDIGCGIGIASEALGKVATRGLVLGLDISDKNIWYARKTISLPNVQFHSIDIIDESEKVQSLLSGNTVDLFILSDVVEHIDEEKRARLFETLSSLASPNAKVLITIPSEFYQRHLMQEHRDELQIIDNVITPTILEKDGQAAGFSMTYFRIIDMWQGAQYAHCILERTAALAQHVRETTSPRPPNTLLRLARRIADKVYFRPQLQRRYLTNVFPEQGR
jgi:trans-aconitate methyltransferase